ncbi:C40 family peptidase [Henriciella aquimarina]|uniref:C40 family peptidase n=1 Tax=Henriciella aquimarina TaxID=545261 RepID=UPI001F3BB475|nr:NlpC/P60 family protein [Henriciella aquimarina]
MPEFDDKRLTLPEGVDGTPMQVSAGTAAIHEAPDAASQMVTQALHGEALMAGQERGGFVRVQLERDRYVGWALKEAVASSVLAPTHKVSALRTYVYSEPDLKSAPQLIVSLGSRLRITGQEGRFLKSERGGWLPEQHVAALDAYETDPAGVAELYLHAPYLWGGCDSLGIDCTGLMRAAFLACGIILPRDSDMQYAWCGEAIGEWRKPGALQRSDLVFWKGHVGIMLDGDIFLHANAHHMAVAKEPLAGAIERIAKIYGEPIGARRIDLVSGKADTPAWLKAG